MTPCALLLFALLPGDAVPPPSIELVRQLGSTSHRERDAAHDALARRGARSADALGQGMHSGDAEVRRRCLDLLRQIDDAELRALVRAPHPVHLRFDKVRLASALLDIEQRTGLSIECPPQLADRRVSVDTGEVPFWQAWQQFCQAAGVSEANHMTFAIPRPQREGLWVTDGKPTVASCVPPRLRVRALRTRGVERGTTAEEHYGGPIAAVLEIRAEPHLDLLAIHAVRIHRALDHEGKPLALAGPTALRILERPALLVDAAGRPVGGKAAWLVSLWLPGLKALHPPRELAGVVDARFLVRRTCISVPAPLQAVGKTVTGARGATMSVRDVTTDDGTTTLTVRLDHLDALLAAGPGAHLQRIRPGVIIARDPLAALLDGLELHDARGRALPRDDFERLDDPGPGVLCRVSFMGVPADGKGTRLVLMARQAVRVEVEFALGK